MLQSNYLNIKMGVLFYFPLFLGGLVGGMGDRSVRVLGAKVLLYQRVVGVAKSVGVCQWYSWMV